MPLLMRIIILILLIILLTVVYIYGRSTQLEIDNFTNLDDRLPIIYINLDKNQDRNQFMLDQFKKYQITNYTRFSGINGRQYELSKGEKRLFANCNFLGRPSTLGTIGCALSHYYVWKSIIQKNIKQMIVLEDDSLLNGDKLEYLDYIKTHLYHYDLIFIHNGLPKKLPKTSNRRDRFYLHRFRGPEWYRQGTIGYVITKKGAEILYRNTNVYTFNRAVDWFMTEQWKSLRIGIVSQSICQPGRFKSTR